ncbi:MAG: PilZ domain-containing protein [Rhodoferax sp.]
MSYNLNRSSVKPPTDQKPPELCMSLLEMQLANGANRLSQEFDGYFQAQEEISARKSAAPKTKLPAKLSNGICRRARASSNLPASIDGSAGITRDISSSGLYVVQSIQYEVGAKIDCLIDLDTPTGKMKLCCEGLVVRIEKAEGRYGIGVRILSQTTMRYN